MVDRRAASQPLAPAQVDDVKTLAAREADAAIRRHKLRTSHSAAAGGGGGSWLDAVPSGNGAGGLDDDEFDDDSIAGEFTALTVSGSATWTEGRDVLSCVYASQTSNDLVAQLKPLSGVAVGDTIEVALRMLTPNQNFNIAGVMFTDGVVAGSGTVNLSYQVGTTATSIELRSGTNTAFITSNHWSRTLGRNAASGWMYLRLQWVSANSFLGQASPDGVSWTSFGNAATAITHTPTHMGVWASTYGGSAPSIVAFEYFRTYT